MDSTVQKKIKAILFDIGGTLIQKRNHGYRDPEIIRQMIALLGAPCLPEELVETIKAGQEAYRAWQKHSFIELSPADKWQLFFLKDYPAELIRTHAEELQELWHRSRGKCWFAPNARQTLQELSARGYILATVSHTSPDYIMDSEIADLFSTHFHAARFGRRKPHPAIFLAAARECGVLPSECAFIGDRLSRDVIGSREAGLGEVILIQNEFTTREVDPCPMQPDAVVSDLSMLLDHFQPAHWDTGVQAKVRTHPVLYDGALSTLNWDPNKMTLNEFFRSGRQMGFARFELNHQIPQEIFDHIDLNSFHIGSLHNPCPAIMHMKVLESEDRLLTSLDGDLRRSAIDVLKNTIETGYRLGARSIVIHSGWVNGDDSMDRKLRELFNTGKQGTPEYESLKHKLIADRAELGKPHLESLIKSLDEVIKFAQGTNLLLGIENLMHYYELPNFDEMRVLMENFSQPTIGWQLDTGHLQIHQNLGLESMQQWLDHFGNRLVGIHHHDVIGINDHLAPGTGNVDFAAIALKIQKQTQITVEVKPLVSALEIITGLEFLARQGCITKLE